MSDVWLGEQLTRYTAGMTTSLIPAPNAAPEPLPVALTAADADRVAAAMSAARTESTRRVYAYTWGQWARWCAARGLTPPPGDPAALCAYLTERAGEGTAVSSLDGACTAIRHMHRMHMAPDPVASETVRQVRLGLRRTYGTAPRRLARPLSTADIRQILASIDRTTPVGIRDAAIILLGYASAMRRSELSPHPPRRPGGARGAARHHPPVQDRPGRPRPDCRRRPRRPSCHRPGCRPRLLAGPARAHPLAPVHPALAQPDRP